MPQERIALSLLLMRLSVFLVMFVWTIDKFLTPEHAIGRAMPGTVAGSGV